MVEVLGGGGVACRGLGCGHWRGGGDKVTELHDGQEDGWNGMILLVWKVEVHTMNTDLKSGKVDVDCESVGRYCRGVSPAIASRPIGHCLLLPHGQQLLSRPSGPI